jgi:acyl carrier protein phosphodiesterase
MNFLAHIYLSGENDNVKLGNFIADGIKGMQYEKYPKEIQIGILLHRKIDWFSDNDNTVKQSKRRLDNRYGHYKGVIIDILYDHFLAKNWQNYSEVPLQEYTRSFYELLQDNLLKLPERIKYLMKYMIADDWLTNYANLNGIERVLIGMNRRTKEISKMHLAINDLKENYEELENDFKLFFDKLSIFSQNTLNELYERMDQNN